MFLPRSVEKVSLIESSWFFSEAKKIPDSSMRLVYVYLQNWVNKGGKCRVNTWDDRFHVAVIKTLAGTVI